VHDGVLVALIALASGMVGAWVQHGFSRRLESARSLAQLRNEAYVSFMKAMSGLAIARRVKNREKEVEFMIMLAESKARIIMYGDPTVIERMAHFFNEYGALNSPEAATALVAMIKSMRLRDGRSQQVSSEAISHLLIGGNNESP
jgi:hypothetical protein